MTDVSSLTDANKKMVFNITLVKLHVFVPYAKGIPSGVAKKNVLKSPYIFVLLVALILLVAK